MRGFAFFSIFIGSLFQYWNLNSDIWFILNSGRYVVEHGIPYTEPLAMHEGLHYVMEQWLTAVMFWEIYDNFGTSGMIAFTFIVGCAVLYMYFRLCLSVGNRIIATVMTIVFGVIASRDFFTTRPQILSILIFIAEVILLEKYTKTRNWKWLLGLPIFSVLLVNLHSALWPMLFVLVLPYIVTYFAGRVMSKAFCPGEYDLNPILLFSVVSFIAGFCNPYGFEAMSFVFISYDPVIHNRLLEMQNPMITTSFGGVFFAILFGVFFVSARNAMPLQYLLIAMGTGFMGLLASRNIIFFYFLGTLPVAYVWRNLILGTNRASLTKFGVLAIAGVLVLWHHSAQNIALDSIPMVAILLMSALVICYFCYLCFYRYEGKLLDTKIPQLRLKYTSGILLMLICVSFFPFYMMQHSKDNAEKQKLIIDFLLSHEKRENIVLWTGFNTGAYAGFRGIKYYVDARPEVFLPSNTHSAENIIGDYFNMTNGIIYYKDFFRDHKEFTHVLVCSADGFFFHIIQHDNDFELMREECTPNQETYRLYRIKRAHKS